MSRIRYKVKNIKILKIKYEVLFIKRLITIKNIIDLFIYLSFYLYF